MTGPMFRFRWSRIDGPELRCTHCGEWWSVGPDAGEGWIIGKWSECRVCAIERSKLHEALRRHDPAYREMQAQKSRRYRKFVREHAPGYLQAYDRQRRVRHAEWQRQYRAQQREKAA